MVKKELFFRTEIRSTSPDHTRSMGSSAERWPSNLMFQQQSNNRDHLSGCFPSGNLWYRNLCQYWVPDRTVDGTAQILSLSLANRGSGLSRHSYSCFCSGRSQLHHAFSIPFFWEIPKTSHCFPERIQLKGRFPRGVVNHSLCLGHIFVRGCDDDWRMTSPENKTYLRSSIVEEYLIINFIL